MTTIKVPTGWILYPRLYNRIPNCFSSFLSFPIPHSTCHYLGGPDNSISFIFYIFYCFYPYWILWQCLPPGFFLPIPKFGITWSSFKTLIKKNVSMYLFLQVKVNNYCVAMYQFSSVTQWCQTPWGPWARPMAGLHVHHQLLEIAQTHVHRVSDAIKPKKLVPISKN